MIHAHTRAWTAVSALADGLMPSSQTPRVLQGMLPITTTKGPAFYRGERLDADLGFRME